MPSKQAHLMGMHNEGSGFRCCIWYAVHARAGLDGWLDSVRL